MLFEDEQPPELVRAMKSLETAHSELDVPWPFDEAKDVRLLSQIKKRYPALNVADMVDKFLVWCTDTRPWEDSKGKPVTCRWSSRLWTWARNQEVYATKKKTNRKTTHYVASEHSEATEVLDDW